MGNCKLPIKDSPEGQDILKRIKAGEIDVLWRALGYSCKDSLLSALRGSYGFYISKEPVEHLDSKPPEVINLPPVTLREYKKQRVRRGDEEEAGLHIGDGHAGKKTDGFDKSVYSQRMDAVFDATMTIVTLHRNMYPINTLRIFDTGDNTQGENPYQGSVIGSVECGARDQTTKIAFPALVRLIASLKQEFANVIFEGYPGNHGYNKLTPETSREDLRLYDLLKAYFHDKKGITINIHESFGDIVDVMGFKFLCTHLDGIQSYSGIPLFAIKRRLDAWYIQFGGFDYVLGGHFHFRVGGYEMSSKYEFSMVSTLVSNDEWALKKLGISSHPSQNIFGVHPERGMTWRYALQVDKQFLPEKVGK